MRKLITSTLLLLFILVSVGFKDDAWDIADLDTARDVDYLTEAEKDVVLEMNKVRTNPELYAKEYIVEVKELYNKKLLTYPGEISILTNEGVSAVNECYRALLKAKPVGKLMPSKGMSFAARDHVKDQSVTGRVGHKGSDKSDSFDRMDRYGQWLKTAGENIDYGNNIGQRIVISLLIDDGVSSRGHRTNIMKPEFNGRHRIF